jgi:hypothetical protein
MYTVYYIWLCNLWEKILPKLNFRFNKAAAEKAKFEKLNNKTAAIGVWGRPNESEVHGPNDMVLASPHLLPSSLLIHQLPAVLSHDSTACPPRLASDDCPAILSVVPH